MTSKQYFNITSCFSTAISPPFCNNYLCTNSRWQYCTYCTFRKLSESIPTHPLYQHFMSHGSIASYYKCNEAEVIEAFYWLLRSQVYCHTELAPYSLKQTADTFFKKWQLHLFHDQKSIFISIKTRMQFSLHLTDVRPAQSMTLRKRHKFKVLKILQVTRMQLGYRRKKINNHWNL